MVEKEKILKKTRIIFLVEYLVVSSVILTLGILKLTGVIDYNPKRLLAYNIITLIGGALVVADFLWAILSKKRRQKVSLMDKFIVLPVGLYLIMFNIFCLSPYPVSIAYTKYSIGTTLTTVGLTQLFIGIYHFFKPSKQILEAVDQEYEAKLKEQEEESKKQEENNPQ